MPGWALKNFGGEIPKTDPRLLPNDNAEQSINCDLSSGNLAGLPIPNFIIDLSAFSAQRAYRFPVPGLADTWLPLPSPYSSVCRSPLANDTLNRLYWTNPANSATPGAFWATQAMIAAGTPPYTLGTIYPGYEVTPTGTPTVTTSGGTLGGPITSWVILLGGVGFSPGDTGTVLGGSNDATYQVLSVSGGSVLTLEFTNGGSDYTSGDYALEPGGAQPGTGGGLAISATVTALVPQVVRSYCWTYVNQYGEESAPSLPSAPITGASDGVWVITGMPTTAPTNPVGSNYPTITGVNLYRTITSSLGASFYETVSFVFGVNSPTSPYTDASADTTIVNNVILYSASFANSPTGLDGLTALPGGMLVGFIGNTVYFCEPDRPFAWPAGYAQSQQYNIMGFGVWQQSLVVMTQGYPTTGSGNSPTNFTFTQVRVPEPCIARGSIITDLMGVYYASQNGLVMLNYFGMQNQTLNTMNKNIWLTRFDAANIIACRHRAQYLALRTDGSGTGFLIDYSEQRLGITELAIFSGVTAVWNDEYSGDAYMCRNGRVHRWDDSTAGPLIYRWRSKQFYGAAPLSLGAVQISSDQSIVTATPSLSDDAGSSDPSLVLPAGVNAVFNMYVGGLGDVTPASTDVPQPSNTAAPTFSRSLMIPREVFRLPSGFKAFDYQFEIVSRVPIHSIEVATTMRELKDV